MQVASPFFNIGVIDAHFKESGKDEEIRAELKQFAMWELLISDVNFKSLGLMLSEVAFFVSNDSTNPFTKSGVNSERKWTKLVHLTKT